MNALLLLDKPKGLSSQEAVTLVKRELGLKKAGHTGTLDPIATGLLIICTGEATKIARFVSDLPKEYVATLKLGERTDSFDAEGTVIQSASPTASREEMETVLGNFRGRIMQTPPMYSALKRGGKPLYKLARKGIVVEREAREVDIFELKLLEFQPPYATLLINCGKGTYIRSLADDIGRSLGTLAYLRDLRRTGIGQFNLQNSASFDRLREKPEAFISIDKALYFLPEIHLDEASSRRAKNGAPVRIGETFQGFLRVMDERGKLFAIGIAREGTLKIERILDIVQDGNPTE